MSIISTLSIEIITTSEISSEIVANITIIQSRPQPHRRWYIAFVPPLLKPSHCHRDPPSFRLIIFGTLNGDPECCLTQSSKFGANIKYFRRSNYRDEACGGVMGEVYSPEPPEHHPHDVLLVNCEYDNLILVRFQSTHLRHLPAAFFHLGKAHSNNHTLSSHSQINNFYTHYLAVHILQSCIIVLKPYVQSFPTCHRLILLRAGSFKQKLQYKSCWKAGSLRHLDQVTRRNIIPTAQPLSRWMVVRPTDMGLCFYHRADSSPGISFKYCN